MPAPIGNRPVTAPVSATSASSTSAAATRQPTVLAGFTPKGTQPSTWNKKDIEFTGSVGGKDVKVSLSPPGSSFWKGDRTAYVDGRGTTYDEAHDLAAALRRAGWGATADLIAKQPSAGALFVNFSEGAMTKEKSVNGTLQNDAFTLTGRLSPESDATVRYEPTADGKGKVFLSVTGGALAAGERELGDAERYQLAERIVHGGDNLRVRQAADFISPAAVKDWERRVPGGPGLDSAGPVKPTFENSVTKPATSWLQDFMNRWRR